MTPYTWSGHLGTVQPWHRSMQRIAKLVAFARAQGINGGCRIHDTETGLDIRWAPAGDDDGNGRYAKIKPTVGAPGGSDNRIPETACGR